MKYAALPFLAILAAMAPSSALRAQPAATPAGPAPLLQLQFAGLAAIESGSEAATLKKILALPETRELLSVVTDKLAGLPFRLAKPALGGAAADRGELIRPLVEDWLRSESWMEWRGSGQDARCVLAVRLSGAQAARWSTNLWQLTSQWGLGTPVAFKAGGLEGWQTPPKDLASPFQFLRRNDWTMLVCGNSSAPWAETLRNKLAREARPVPDLKDKFLDVTLDTPALGDRFPIVKRLGLPPMQCSVQGEGEYVRTKAQWRLASPLNLNLRPWNIPTNAISNPGDTLVSFTVARGIEPFLKSISAGDFLQPLPDQLCAWGQSQFLGQTVLAFPLPDPTNAVVALSQKFPPWVTNLFGGPTGTFVFNTNKSELVWQRLPLLIPFAKPFVDHQQPYLITGFYPMIAGPSNTAPAEMYGAVARKPGLVYYDWEITGPRFMHNGQFFQLGMVLAKRRTQSTNAVTFRWTQKINSLLGNSITEVTQTSPTQFDLVRKSHLGLTGVELLAFCRWIDSPEFPLSINLPETILEMIRNRQQKPPDKDARPKTAP